MTTTHHKLALTARTASDLMAPNPHSLRDSATVHEATTFLIENDLDAAPVVNEAGRAVGVLSKSDILIHYFEQMNHPFPSDAGTKRIEGLMTPGVFAITVDSPMELVIQDLAKLNVGQLYVVDDGGSLVGVIRAQHIIGALIPGNGA